jgi:hypothetical protein
MDLATFRNSLCTPHIFSAEILHHVTCAQSGLSYREDPRQNVYRTTVGSKGATNPLSSGICISITDRRLKKPVIIRAACVHSFESRNATFHGAVTGHGILTARTLVNSCCNRLLRDMYRHMPRPIRPRRASPEVNHRNFCLQFYGHFELSSHISMQS